MQTQVPPLRTPAMTSRRAECVTLRETGAALAFATHQSGASHAQHSRHPTLTYAGESQCQDPAPYCMASDDEVAAIIGVATLAGKK